MKIRTTTMVIPKGCILYISGVPVMLEAPVRVKVCVGKSSAGMVKSSIAFSGRVSGVPLEGLELHQLHQL
jgi:hypothetical protein